MPISVKCACGKAFRCKDEYAGKKIRCTHCKEVLTLPTPEPDPEQDALSVLLTESDSSEENRSPRHYEREPEPPPARVPTPTAPPPRPVKVEKKPKEKQKKEREGYSGIAFEEGWFGSVNSGAVGGILMMVIAIVWFVAGYMSGYIYFYPPVLLVIGLVSLMKGLFAKG